MEDMVQILPDHLYTLTQWQQRGDWVITPVHLLTHLVRQHPHNGGQGSDAIWWLVHTHIVTKEKRLSDHTCPPSDSPRQAASPQWGTRFRCYLMTCILSHNDEREWSHLSFWLTLSGSMATMGTRFRCYWWLVHTHTTTKERRLNDHLSSFWLTLSGSMATMGTRFRCSVQRQPVIQNMTFIKCLILLLVILISVNNTHMCTHTYTDSFTTQPHI